MYSVNGCEGLCFDPPLPAVSLKWSISLSSTVSLASSISSVNQTWKVRANILSYSQNLYIGWNSHQGDMLYVHLTPSSPASLLTNLDMNRLVHPTQSTSLPPKTPYNYLTYAYSFFPFHPMH